MKFSFKRITSSGKFFPEIDGLRFIAISSVILYHYWCFISVKDLHQYSDQTDYSFLTTILSHGKFGVELFFVISGFILGMPFAKFYFEKGEKVNIGKYFFRRLTRLEPPYIVAMTLLFFGAVFVAKTISLPDGIASYFSSIFYIHNFVYPGNFPFINTVAWSLEIEVQFYILAPLIAFVFRIYGAVRRRLVIIGLISFFITLNALYTFSFLSLVNFIQYFLIGFLLVDVFINKHSILPKTRYDFLIALPLLFIIWLYDAGEIGNAYQKMGWMFTQVVCIFFLYYYILFHKVFRILSMPLITNIGGMCYSIYLIHYAIISLIGNKLMEISFSKYSYINVAIYCIIFTFAIGIICSLFFLLIERPCMDKNWYKQIWKKSDNSKQGIKKVQL